MHTATGLGNLDLADETCNILFVKWRLRYREWYPSQYLKSGSKMACPSYNEANGRTVVIFPIHPS
jgi:hypothetical protein